MNKKIEQGIIICMVLLVAFVVVPIGFKHQDYNDKDIIINDTIQNDSIEDVFYHQVTATIYHPVEEECDSDPLTTADGSKINLKKLKHGELNWIAMSQDLIGTRYNYGDIIEIISEDEEINGLYEIHDTMNKRFTNRIDILTYPGRTRGKGKWNIKIRKI